MTGPGLTPPEVLNWLERSVGRLTMLGLSETQAASAVSSEHGLDEAKVCGLLGLRVSERLSAPEMTV